MPVYNMEKFISFAIDSVLGQTVTDFELIIIDDGSTDSSQKIIAEYTEKIPAHSCKIKYSYQENRGLACARNAGIKMSSGKYIALLDPDDIWLPTRLEKGIEILDNNSNVGLVHANIIVINELNEEIYSHSKKPKFLSGRIYKNLLLRYGHIACPTVLFRRTCLDEVGMFDEYLTYLGCEDRDLWLRIALRYEIFYINEVLAFYRKVDGSMSSKFEKMITARKYVIEKNTIGRSRLLLRRQCFAAMHKEMGDHLATSEEYRFALLEYYASIVYWPFNIYTLYCIVKNSVIFLKNSIG